MAASGRNLPPELTSVLNDYLGIGQPPPGVASAGQARSQAPASSNQRAPGPATNGDESVVLDLGDADAPPAPEAPQTQPADGQRTELVLIWKLVWRYAPFLLLLFAKLMYEHRLGLLCLLGFYGTFYYANLSLKKSISSRDLNRTETMKLLFIPAYLAFNCWFVYYVFYNEQLHRCLYFMPPNMDSWDLSTLLWVVGVTDFVIRFTSISLKSLVAAVPRIVIPVKSKGKYYMLIEHCTQYYRRLTPLVPWYYFLTDTSQRGGAWFSWLLFAVYVLFKLQSLYVKTKELLLIIRNFLSNSTYGVKPSHSDLSSVSEGCPICQDDYQHPVMLQCKHIFCEDCVSLWFDREQTCPMCRAKAVKDAPSWRDGSTSPFMQLF